MAETAGFIQTVTGPLDPAAAGHVLVREHAVADFTTPLDTELGWAAVGRVRPDAATDRRFYEGPLTLARLGRAMLGRPNRDNETLDEAWAAAELADFAAVGGVTLADVTLSGQGRDPAALVRLAGAGVHLVAAAGWAGEAWAPEIAGLGAGELAERLVADLGETGVGRPGLVGPVLWDGGPLAEAALLAAAATGAPVIVDLTRDAEPAALERLLAASGADPGQVALGHAQHQLDRARDWLGLGCWLLCDGLGRIPTVYTEVMDHDVAVALIGLAAAGETRLLVSAGVDRKAAGRSYGGNGYGFLARQFGPYLAGLAGDGALSEALLRSNPAQFLSWRGGR
jgi:phosphotriesterase-related protein